MKNSLDIFLQTLLAQHQEQHLQRVFHPRQNIFNAHAQYANKDYLAFTNNDYLGLSHHPNVIQAAQQAAEEYGVGSTASHTLGGHCEAHEELEHALAAFTQRSAALVFSTGFMANLGTISALMSAQDHIFADRLVHASIIDGIHLSKARLTRYHHNNMEHLQLKLSRYTEGHKLIVSDGVFSMDGDIAPMPELIAIAQKNQAWLMIDDAHGLGVLGKNGGGCCEQFNLTENEVPILVGTLSKALGCFGGFVAGSKVLIESIKQFARAYMFTTALPPLLARASLASLEIIKTETWRREYLQELINYFRTRAAEINLPLMPSATPIQPILIGDNLRVLEIQQQLREQGILVAAIRPPTVPANTARLRVSLNALHTRADVDRLITALLKK
jgi:8-amino-7-oxononanoate synthase